MVPSRLGLFLLQLFIQNRNKNSFKNIFFKQETFTSLNHTYISRNQNISKIHFFKLKNWFSAEKSS